MVSSFLYIVEVHFSDDGKQTPDRPMRLFYVSRTARSRCLIVLDSLFQGQSNYSLTLFRAKRYILGRLDLSDYYTCNIIYLTSSLRTLTLVSTRLCTEQSNHLLLTLLQGHNNYFLKLRGVINLIFSIVRLIKWSKKRGHSNYYIIL